MFTVLMIYLVVALVIFVAALINEICFPDPDNEYSRIAILAQCIAAAVFWPLICFALIIIRAGDWFFLPRKGKGSMGGTCGFCNAYYYRQMPGYAELEKARLAERMLNNKSKNKYMSE